MDTPLSSHATVELRSVIRFLLAKGKKPAEIHREIVAVYGSSAMSVQMVRKWCRAFAEGRQNVVDEQRSGRPSTATEGEAVNCVSVIVERDGRLTLDDIVESLPPHIEISRRSVATILNDKLGMTKVCARWVPRLLTPDHKRNRIESAQKFFELLDLEGDDIWDRIVTGDETWVHHTTPETKQQSMVWQKKGAPPPKKAKVVLSAGKVMATVFWDRKGVLLVDYLPRGQTINADRYCEVLKDLRRAIQNKRRGMLSKGVLLLHDNARPHTARKTVELLGKFNWDIIPHPPYSPDLAPSDYYLFPKLKVHLGGSRFTNDEELKAAVEEFLKEVAAADYEAGLKKLLPRLQKCVEKNGDYVEK